LLGKRKRKLERKLRVVDSKHVWLGGSAKFEFEEEVKMPTKPKPDAVQTGIPFVLKNASKKKWCI